MKPHTCASPITAWNAFDATINIGLLGHVRLFPACTRASIHTITLTRCPLNQRSLDLQSNIEAQVYRYAQSHLPNDPMEGHDPVSPTAPARVRVLVLPVGRIKKSRFMSFVSRLQQESAIRLGDISPDGRPDKSTHTLRTV